MKIKFEIPDKYKVEIQELSRAIHVGLTLQINGAEMETKARRKLWNLANIINPATRGKNISFDHDNQEFWYYDEEDDEQ